MQQKYIMKKIEIIFYRNRMITEIKEAQIIKNYIDPMLNYKRNQKHWKKNQKNDSEIN